jgi:hypothetical protein
VCVCHALTKNLAYKERILSVCISAKKLNALTTSLGPLL